MRVSRKSSAFLIEGSHAVVTAWFQGWAGLKNGALLDAAEQTGFDLFITADQEIRYQQDLSGRRLALLVLSTNNWAAIKANVAALLRAIDAVTPGSYSEVDIPFE